MVIYILKYIYNEYKKILMAKKIFFFLVISS